MKIYPALDILGGKVVRLYKGKRDSYRVYGDPLELARHFSRLVDKIHVVDLDGAFEGKPRNLTIVKKIVEETGLRVQIGGGFRTLESIREAYRAGVENVILGTKALDVDFIKIVSDEFPGLTVSIDVIDGKVAIKGWKETTFHLPEEIFNKLRPFVHRFIYTHIDKDGTLEGVGNVRKFWGDEEFIYAGGVSSLKDVLKLKEIGFSGVVVGKAIYEKEGFLEELVENLEA